MPEYCFELEAETTNVGFVKLGNLAVFLSNIYSEQACTQKQVEPGTNIG